MTARTTTGNGIKPNVRQVSKKNSTNQCETLCKHASVAVISQAQTRTYSGERTIRPALLRCTRHADCCPNTRPLPTTAVPSFVAAKPSTACYVAATASISPSAEALYFLIGVCARISGMSQRLRWRKIFSGLVLVHRGCLSRSQAETRPASLARGETADRPSIIRWMPS